MNTTFIAAALVPIVSYLIRIALAEPLEELAKEKLPPKIAKILTAHWGSKRN